jgi:hypothetical protein
VPTLRCTDVGLVPPALVCNPNACRVPSIFPKGYEGVDCLAGATLKNGETCQVRCSKSFSPRVYYGRAYYMCEMGILVAPTIDCQPSDCFLMKDALCFDAMYTCHDCCNTDRNAVGNSCWDATYPRSRCCFNEADPPYWQVGKGINYFSSSIAPTKRCTCPGFLLKQPGTDYCYRADLVSGNFMSLIECDPNDSRQCFISFPAKFQTLTVTVMQVYDSVKDLRPGFDLLDALCADDIRLNGQLGVYKCRAGSTSILSTASNIHMIGYAAVNDTQACPGFTPTASLPSNNVAFQMAAEPTGVSIQSSSTPAPYLTYGATLTLVSTLSPSSATCAKDTTCFDALYPCDLCCRTNKRANGDLCFDSYFSRDRCCYWQLNPALSLTDSTSQTSCAKDPGCFDFMYPCNDCCRRHMNNAGKPCWTDVFTPEKCCRDPSTQPLPSVLSGTVALLAEANAGPADSRGNTMAVDSRGYPVSVYVSGLDSRGRPKDQSQDQTEPSTSATTVLAECSSTFRANPSEFRCCLLPVLS